MVSLAFPSLTRLQNSHVLKHVPYLRLGNCDFPSGDPENLFSALGRGGEGERCPKYLILSQCVGITNEHIENLGMIFLLEMSECPNITKVWIPYARKMKSITVQYCPDLLSVEIRNGMDYAHLSFVHCQKLVKVVIPGSTYHYRYRNDETRLHFNRYHIREDDGGISEFYYYQHVIRRTFKSNNGGADDEHKVSLNQVLFFLAWFVLPFVVCFVFASCN
jgi:hypothetical protein